ncbi:putative F-box protein At1g32020 [Salvia hispanica]|uniref:putative F-box protein At1g32020 n=1 Tax=Salvia hispanica TaxID=49212 RepID=UPI0020097DEF|nr:putative F-box protein At1g32020 [Salvia hispanica]
MEEDRMSQLPDDILLLILDKIDIYEAVETMILSHRWKNVWRSLTGLRFHFHVPSGFRCNSIELRPKILPQCQRVSQFLFHRDPTAAVRGFHLSYDNPGYVNREFMEEWVLYAINHGVQKLRALEINQISDKTYSFSAKEISAPLLTSFRYEAPKAWECAKVNLPMLEQVYLDIYESIHCDNHTNSVTKSCSGLFETDF